MAFCTLISFLASRPRDFLNIPDISPFLPSSVLDLISPQRTIYSAPMKILGIDPGAGGALAVLNTEDSSLEIFDMPVVEIKKGSTTKRHVSAQLVAELLRAKSIDHAFVEAVHAMPGQGVSSSFSFGRALGVLEGVLGALQIPVTLVPPAVWLREMRTKIGKDGSRARAVELWPKYAALFARKKDDGRAESALLAAYGARHGCA